MYVIFTLLSLYFLFALVTGTVVAHVTTHPDVNNFKKEKEELLQLGFDVDRFLKDFKVENHVCISTDGYKIHYSLIKKEGSKSTVIIAHGYCGNRFSVYPYVQMFAKFGFNCVVYDQRGHGENEKAFTTMGFYESEDFIKVAENSLKLLGAQKTIGFAGVSMGAATVLLAQRKGLKPDFIISDSSYSSLGELIRYRIAYLKKPRCRLTVPVSGAIFRLIYHIRLKEISPLIAVKNTDENIPILFIHGRCDKTVPYTMFEELYKAKKGLKQSFVSDGQPHAKMIFNEPDLYQKTLSEFLSKYVHKSDK